MVARPTFTESFFEREYYRRLAAETALQNQNRPATREQIESLQILAERIGIYVYVGKYLTAEQASIELATLAQVIHRMESWRQEPAG